MNTVKSVFAQSKSATETNLLLMYLNDHPLLFLSCYLSNFKIQKQDRGKKRNKQNPKYVLNYLDPTIVTIWLIS